MQIKDLLLITKDTQKLAKVEKLLKESGVHVTVASPSFLKSEDFALFSEQLSTHRFVAKIEGASSLTLLIDNFLIQHSIFAAQNLQIDVPDMWVQFGSNIPLMQESKLDAEKIVERILQELVAHDYRPLSKRKQKPFV